MIRSACVFGLSMLVALVGAGCASDLSAEEARRLVRNGARLVDVRSRAEFAERHVEGSVNIPVEELKGRLSELGEKTNRLVVYCHTGVRSGFAILLLRKAGFAHVYNLGSIGRWYTGTSETPSLY